MDKKYKLIVLFGESGAGKDTVQKTMADMFPSLLNPIVSCTTRPKRDYEVDGVHYHFLTTEKMKEMIDNKDMLEYSIFNNWYYGTGLISLDPNKINIGVFNLQGLQSLMHSDQVEFIPVYVHACGKTRLLRNLNREEFPDCKEICRRYLADDQEFYSAYTILYDKKNFPASFQEGFFGIPIIRFENEEGTDIKKEIKHLKPIMNQIKEWAEKLNLS